MIKNAVRGLLRASVGLARRTRLGTYRHDLIVSSAMEQTRTVTHAGLELVLPVPNALCRYRAESFSSKEPETLEWIDGLPVGSVLWDVGANVGLYSVYAACRRQCRVFAFEPSVFNLELLARNTHLNQVCDRVCIVPLALSDGLGSSRLRMTSTEWGGALSTFGRDFGFDGRAMRPIFEYQTLGITMEDAVYKLNLPAPEYIKIDVDGIEHLILRGGEGVLRAVRGVLIEINDNFREQAEQASALLLAAGLRLAAKRQSDLIEASTTGHDKTFNQIWERGESK
jgi:FkbM family methyltransferase